MARYLVTVHRSPGRVQVGGRRFEAADRQEAQVKAYRIAGQVIRLRRVAPTYCQYKLFDVSRSDGIPYLLLWRNYQRPGTKVGPAVGEPA